MRVRTSSVSFEQSIADVGLEDLVFDAGGIGKRVRLFRLPDELRARALKGAVPIPLEPDRDNPVFLRVTTEDGHLIWTSPIYVIPAPVN